MSSPRQTRRTRIVCISDTHNTTPKLPKGDVLIHAGDLSNQGSYSELSKAIRWLENTDFEVKIIIAGNHDVTLDREFYARHGPTLHNRYPQDPEKCLTLLTSNPAIIYLQHSSATIRLTDPKGPGTEFTVFGSPFCPEYGTWAFMYPSPGTKSGIGLPNENRDAAGIWADIPPDTDILITHTPPYGHCDAGLGCRELQKRLGSVRPRLHVCGHIHQGRGAERVKWYTASLTHPEDIAPEASVDEWQDPNPDPQSAKMSLLDLTARGGKQPLDFEDSAATVTSSFAKTPNLPVLSKAWEPSVQDNMLVQGSELWDVRSFPIPGPGTSNTNDAGIRSGAIKNKSPLPAGNQRLGRRETCIVNCAIMATSWPHLGGKRLNKPIVVDLDLPVWKHDHSTPSK